MNLKELEEILVEHCIDMEIFQKNAEIKKIESILDSIISAIVRSYTPYEDVIECIKDVKEGRVINISLFENGGNVWDYVSEKWHNFAKALWRQRSVGLGTPNAASGEGELMFIFLSSKIKKPTKGDLSINGENIELKGEGVRVVGKISGKDFRNKTLELCKKYNLQPNKAYKTNIEACEIEKSQHINHWNNQMRDSLNENQQKQFITEWLMCIDGKEHCVNKIFEAGFNHQTFVKEITKILYGSMVDDRSFDKFVMLGNGSNVKVISGDKDEFNTKIDNGEIVIGSDYFRINQTYNIGWYVN